MEQAMLRKNLMSSQQTKNEENPILVPLNSRQKEAVLTTEGPVLIIAGAGSGKTKALTHRVAHLIQKGVRPENILAVTFTNKAAREMDNRIKILTKEIQKDGSGNPFIGTFHSFCVRILRNESSKIGYTRFFTIFDDDDSISLIKDILKELNVNPKQFPAAMVMSVISGLKSELVTSADYEGKNSGELFPKTIYAVFELYEKRLKQSNALDFDGLITKTVLLFQSHPDVLEKYQNRFRYIHIDEYQDTNTAQYELSKLLAAKFKNIFVIGDDAQSIYSWRNADFRNI
ncbi:MAG: UvrD-helicase domain-containing protein, partial [Candidatus Sungbacteria bacterium]|nr:UvrD-helicase domain-containing protein [Candidatus Sungbacteria bacterium]